MDSEVNKPFAEIEGASDDEVADSLIGSLAPSLRNINDEGNIEKDQEGIAETHLKEVVDKQGLSPIKRGRSRHRRNGQKIKRQDCSLLQGKESKLEFYPNFL